LGIASFLALPGAATAQMGGGMGGDGASCMMSGMMWVVPLGFLLVLVLVVLGIAALLKYLFTRRDGGSERAGETDTRR